MAKKRNKEVNGAVLYIRVSTDEQADGPLNLKNQEMRCRAYCEQKGLEVVELFVEPGESARSADRPAFKRMLAFCKANRSNVRYVVVQDLSRFARNLEDQVHTIGELLTIDVLVRSTFETNVDETAAGRLSANIFGGFHQYFSDALSEKMQERTRQSVAAGRFPWRAPIGYRNIGGKAGPNIVPDERSAPLIRRAFQLMAKGLHKKIEILRIVTDEGLKTAKGKPLSPQTFQSILRNPLYVGWVTLPSDASFGPVRGLHEPIIDQNTFDQVQAILEGRKPSTAPKRKFNPMLPLKCLIRCESCGSPLTGGNAKGRHKKYPRYWCRTKGCRAVKLSGAQLETEFLELLSRLRPNAETVSSFPKVAAKVWAEKQGDSERDLRRLNARLEEQKSTKSGLIKMRMHGEITLDEFDEAKANCVNEIARIESEIREINSRRDAADSFVQFAELQLLDIAKAWQIANPEQRQRVQNLLFKDGLQYSQKSGILNPSNSSLFSVLKSLSCEKALLASPTGFEPVLSP